MARWTFADFGSGFLATGDLGGTGGGPAAADPEGRTWQGDTGDGVDGEEAGEVATDETGDTLKGGDVSGDGTNGE